MMFIKNFASVCFFLFITLSCHAQEIYDVETIPLLRTKSYPIGPYKKIIVFSAPRTGSSLIYNIFRFLFEDDTNLLAYHDNFSLDHRVLRTHKFPELYLIEMKKTFYVFTLRDPLTASISNYRICTHNNIKNKSFAKELINKHCKHLLFSETMGKKGMSILRLKYEEFVDNLDFIFNKIEDHFHITIDPRDKEIMRKAYSKENIHACIKDLEDFREYLPISGFHGQHIPLQKYAPPKDFLHWLKVYLNDALPLLQRHEYYLDTQFGSD